MKRSVAKRALNTGMADNLLIKGEAKAMVIKVEDIRTTVVTMIATTMISTALIAAAMIAAATMAVARNTAVMTAHVTAIGVTTNNAAPITKGVANAIITMMTGSAKAVATMPLTMLRTEHMLQVAPLALVCAHITGPGAALTTLASPISLVALATPK